MFNNVFWIIVFCGGAFIAILSPVIYTIINDNEELKEHEVRSKDPKEELQKIKAENAKKAAEEAAKKKLARKEKERWISRKAEILCEKVVIYFVKERISSYSFEMKLGLRAKATFWDTRSLSWKFVDVYNEIDTRDEEIFLDELKTKLFEQSIRFEREFHRAGDFATASDIYEFEFHII